MYEEYYGEYFEKPTELDLIIEDADDKFRQVLKENIKSLITDVKNNEIKHNKLLKQISELEYKKKTIIKEIDNLVDEVNNLKQNRLPKMYYDKCIDLVTKSIKPGDKIWLVSDINHADCNYCDGSGKINVNYKDEKFEINCPKCKGKGFTTYHKYQSYSLEVRSVNVKVLVSKDKYFQVDFDYIETVDYRRFDSLKYIYLSEAEANEVADERNASIGVFVDDGC